MSIKKTPIIKIRPYSDLEIKAISYLGLDRIRCVSSIDEYGLCNYRWITEQYDSTCLRCLQCSGEYWFVTDQLTSNFHQVQ